MYLSGFLVFSKFSHPFGFASFQKKGNRSFITSRSHGHPSRPSSETDFSLQSNSSVLCLKMPAWPVKSGRFFVLQMKTMLSIPGPHGIGASLSLYDLRYHHSTTIHSAQKVSRCLRTALQHKKEMMLYRVPCYLIGFC